MKKIEHDLFVSYDILSGNWLDWFYAVHRWYRYVSQMRSFYKLVRQPGRPVIIM